MLRGDAERLEAVTEQKNAAIAAHRQQQQQRGQWMSHQGLRSDDSLAEVAARFDADGSHGLLDVQRQLADLAERCQERNRQNGGLIAKLQQRARDALGVLRREDATDLYSLSGARERSSDNRIIGKA